MDESRDNTDLRKAANLNTADADSKVIANRLAVVGVAGNVALALFKFVCGIIAQSSAMVSDAIHSSSDVLATAIAYIGVRISKQPADKGHPYGHERFECLASGALAMLLVVVGVGLGAAGVQQVVAYVESGCDAQALGNSTDAPMWLAALAAVVSIAAKEVMYRYTLHWGRVMGSPAFVADAKHHRSDALSSVGALIGITATMLGFPLGDPLASVLICVFILKMAWEVVHDAADRMLDVPCDDETEAQMRACLLRTPGVENVDLLHTRMFGAKVYVDAEIAVDGSLILRDAHAIAEAAHDSLEAEFPDVKHVMIHVNPA